jgi:acyl-coenzyme A thioesterase PaaI-like protein
VIIAGSLAAGLRRGHTAAGSRSDDFGAAGDDPWRPRITSGHDAAVTALSLADVRAVLADNFAPWVLDLGLVVEEVGDRHAITRLPWSDRLAREGGALSGQALMAAADTTTVLALSAARGSYGAMTTVQQSTSFQRAVVGQDVLLTARVERLGRSLAFVDVTMGCEGDETPRAHATTVYALLG